MKEQQNDFIIEFLKEIVGDDGISLFETIQHKENVSEFKIADKLNITINQVRHILYKLNEHNLVSSTRKKDKKKGWYIYFWTFDHKKARNLIEELKKKKLEQLKQSLKQEQTQIFYICPSSCMRVSSETALEYQFKCQECDRLLVPEDTTKKISTIKQDIEKLKQDLEALQNISEVEHQAFLRKEEKIKAKIREERRLARQKTLKKKTRQTKKTVHSKQARSSKKTKRRVSKKIVKKEKPKQKSVFKKKPTVKTIKKSEVQSEKKSFVGRLKSRLLKRTP